MKNIDTALVNRKVEQAAETAALTENKREVLLECMACTDYTTLKETDSPHSVTVFTNHAIELTGQGLPPVASICVYPSLVDAVGVALTGIPAGSPAENIGITAVCGAFPSGQTYMEVKMLECAMAIENGADEIDAVINVGAMLSGDYDLAESELAMIREEIDGDAVLKVILETGSLADPELIYRASMLAMEAGADFIKTSTGKTPISATPAAAVVMCRAIRDFERSCSRRVGIKVAGGIRTPQEAVLYRTIVAQELGEEWLTPSLFRIGASRLVDALAPRLLSETV
ncbi:deoxyribose-phosphate aldolase [Rikenella microfusus]|uniref:deoxyribose-phosphate aldolase n=1 Tax=Rikenella microfusus TaxID=28139 RepID=UPI001D4777DF|nr:deoxyribose-phosphate aldolase [Rikenella microfusus]HJE88473.1 deoxyribose-phosphate aldolase [Rikenella microfusus]